MQNSSHPALSNALATHYDVAGDLEELYASVDQVFRCRETSDHTQSTGIDSNGNNTFSDQAGDYVVKLMRADTEQQTVEMQCQILQHLQRSEFTLTPQLKLTTDGKTFAQLTEEKDQYFWVAQFLTGTLAADYQPHDDAVLKSLGQSIAALHHQLLSFDHPGLHRPSHWKLCDAEWTMEHLNLLDQFDTSTSCWLRCVANEFITQTQPALKRLSSQAIHGDVNDHNVLFDYDAVAGIFDFGDCHSAPRVTDLAVACAYFMMNKDNPWLALRTVIEGYHQHSALDQSESELLFSLIGMRLVQSLVHSQLAKASNPTNEYLQISQQPALRLAAQLLQFPRAFGQAWVSSCCQQTRLHDKLSAIQSALLENPSAGVINAQLSVAEVLDLSPASLHPRDPFSGQLDDPLAQRSGIHTLPVVTKEALAQSTTADKNKNILLGKYGEPRLLYQAPEFKSGDHPSDDARTIHAGVDIFAAPDTAIIAPLDAVVYAIEQRKARQDYGPTVILQHELAGHSFFTLYGHLSMSCLETLKVGSTVAKGDVFCHIGAPPINGDWPPHLHFQWVLEDLDSGTNIDGVCHPWAWPVWQQLFANPATLLNLADSFVAHAFDDNEKLLSRRHRALGKNLSVSYSEPVHAVRGWQQYLFDDYGRCYLDAYNNVPHVGHGNEGVARAVSRQMHLLSTNSRYLHKTRIEYAERLAEKFPSSLDVCFFLNSASEANELALRLARNFTQAKDMLVIDDAYHGNTTTLVDISPYKAQNKGGSGCPDWVHILPAVDLYRGDYQYHHANAGHRYAEQVREKIEQLRTDNRSLCGFICESLPSVGGQLVFPNDYLTEVYAHVHAAGGLCIADEVQTGFGRVGDYFWGFEQQQVTPDIVVLGKPIGNGFPLAAVVTRKEISDAFDNGMEFFSTFGANTVACAAGLEVLNIVESENIQQHIKSVGDYMKQQLVTNLADHDLVGDVRGMGLFLGVEIVTDKKLKTPGTTQASHIKNRMRQNNILIGTDGPHDNVLKIRPPSPFNHRDADRLVTTLTRIMSETQLRQIQSAG